MDFYKNFRKSRVLYMLSPLQNIANGGTLNDTVERSNSGDSHEIASEKSENTPDSTNFDEEGTPVPDVNNCNEEVAADCGRVVTWPSDKASEEDIERLLPRRQLLMADGSTPTDEETNGNMQSESQTEEEIEDETQRQLDEEDGNRNSRVRVVVAVEQQQRYRNTHQEAQVEQEEAEELEQQQQEHAVVSTTVTIPSVEITPSPPVVFLDGSNSSLPSSGADGEDEGDDWNNESDSDEWMGGIYGSNSMGSMTPMSSCEEILTPLQSLEKYVSHEVVMNRQTVARNILEGLRSCCDDTGTNTITTTATVQRIVRIIDTLAHDAEPTVKLELIDQIPNLAAYCWREMSPMSSEGFGGGGEFAGHPIPSPNQTQFMHGGDSTTGQMFPLVDKLLKACLLPVLMRLTRDINMQVRKMAQLVVQRLLERRLVDAQIALSDLLPSVVDVNRPTVTEDQRCEAVALMRNLAQFIGPDDTAVHLVDPFLVLCGDQNFRVRVQVASAFGRMCSSLGPHRDIIEERLVQKFYTLCDDSIWGVRKACVESLPDVAGSVGPRVRREELSPRYLRFLSDATRCVKQAAYQHLGLFISTFADPAAALTEISPLGAYPRETVEPLRECLVATGNARPHEHTTPLPTSQQTQPNQNESSSLLQGISANDNNNNLNMSPPPPPLPTTSPPPLDDEGSGVVTSTTTSGAQSCDAENNVVAASNNLECGVLSVEENDNNAGIQNCGGDVANNNNASSNDGDGGVVSRGDEGIAPTEAFDEVTYWRDPLPALGDLEIDQLMCAPVSRMALVCRLNNRLSEGGATVADNRRGVGGGMMFSSGGAMAYSSLGSGGVTTTTMFGVDTSTESSCDSQPDNVASLAKVLVGPNQVPAPLLAHYARMLDAQLSDELETVDLSRHCAYTLPAVALAVGRDAWATWLLQVFKTLAADMQWKVRYTVASSLHALVTILGPRITCSDILPVLRALMSDLEEVKIRLLSRFDRIVATIDDAEVRRQLLWHLSLFMSAADDQDGQNYWRLRHSLAQQLCLLPALYPAKEVSLFLVPLIVALLDDKVAEVRRCAAAAMGPAFGAIAGVRCAVHLAPGPPVPPAPWWMPEAEVALALTTPVVKRLRQEFLVVCELAAAAPSEESVKEEMCLPDTPQRAHLSQQFESLVHRVEVPSSKWWFRQTFAECCRSVMEYFCRSLVSLKHSDPLSSRPSFPLHSSHPFVTSGAFDCLCAMSQDRVANVRLAAVRAIVQGLRPWYLTAKAEEMESLRSGDTFWTRVAAVVHSASQDRDADVREVVDPLHYANGDGLWYFFAPSSAAASNTTSDGNTNNNNNNDEETMTSSSVDPSSSTYFYAHAQRSQTSQQQEQPASMADCTGSDEER